MSDSLITKKAIAAALKQVCREKPFDKISIADITAVCGLNRQTFYYHFQDKYELLSWIYYNENFSKITEDITFDNWDQKFLEMLRIMEKEKPKHLQEFLIPVIEDASDYGKRKAVLCKHTERTGTHL